MKYALALSIALRLAPLVGLRAAEASPIVGAIRWDAWYGDGSVTKAVEATLGHAPAQRTPAAVMHLGHRDAATISRRTSARHSKGRKPTATSIRATPSSSTAGTKTMKEAGSCRRWTPMASWTPGASTR